MAKKKAKSRAGAGGTPATQARSGSDPNEGLIRTQGGAAKYAGVTAKTIRRWKNERGMPMAENGWYIKSVLDLWKSSEDSDAAARQRLIERAEATENRRLKNDLLRAKLGLIQGDWERKRDERDVRKVIVVKRALLGVGRKVAPQLAGKKPAQIRRIIDAEVKHIIETFSGAG